MYCIIYFIVLKLNNFLFKLNLANGTGENGSKAEFGEL